MSDRSLIYIFSCSSSIFYASPTLLALGITVRYILQTLVFHHDELKFKHFRESIYIFSQENLINYIFADHGFEIFTLIYVIAAYSKIRMDSITSRYESVNGGSVEPNEETVIVENKSQVKGYIIQYSIVIIALVALLAVKYIVLSYTKFIISGHFISLVTFTICLYFHIQSTLAQNDTLQLAAQNDEDENRGTTLYRSFIAIIIASISLLVVWFLLLFVTSVFYHTFTEKVAGLVLGYLPYLLAFKVFISQLD